MGFGHHKLPVGSECGPVTSARVAQANLNVLRSGLALRGARGSSGDTRNKLHRTMTIRPDDPNPIETMADAGSDKLRLFTVLFGGFTVLHVIGYLVRYQAAPSWDLFALGMVGFAAVIWPGARMFAALIIMSLISGWEQAPVGSNHTMLRNVVVLGGALLIIVRRGVQVSFADFAVLGGACLMVMYVFGIFHKINTDFLNPEISCGPALWAWMPPPLSWIKGAWMDQAAIWGTFIVEGAILIALLTKRFRHAGVVAGIGFHGLLSLTNYSMYIPFTSLAIALHALFLSEEGATRIARSALGQWALNAARSPARILLLLLAFLSVAILTRLGLFVGATIAAGVLLGPVCLAIALYGHGGVRQSPSWAGRTVTAVIAGGFFLLCLTPYSGLRTVQSMNMFANLRVEGGVSNHLIFGPPTMFDHVDDVVTIQAATGSRLLTIAANRDRIVPWRQVLIELADNPAATVTYRRNGGEAVEVTATDLREEIDQLPHRWVRKFIHYRSLPATLPLRCI